MLDALAGAVAVLLSLGLALGGLYLLRDRPIETRGMAGLAATGAHLLLSVIFPAIVWAALRPAKPLVFVVSVLAFYWISLIILVVTIVRWLRSGSPPANQKNDQNPR